MGRSIQSAVFDTVKLKMEETLNETSLEETRVFLFFLALVGSGTEWTCGTKCPRAGYLNALNAAPHSCATVIFGSVTTGHVTL